MKKNIFQKLADAIQKSVQAPSESAKKTVPNELYVPPTSEKDASNDTSVEASAQSIPVNEIADSANSEVFAIPCAAEKPIMEVSDPDVPEAESIIKASAFEVPDPVVSWTPTMTDEAELGTPVAETANEAQEELPELDTTPLPELCSTYFDYCQALQNGDVDALLVHYVRTWFVSLVQATEIMDGPLTLDRYVAPRPERLDQDALSYILYRCNSAFAHILNNMRDKIVRENVMMPVQKAREIDSAGIYWLCRRPGNTVREKLSGTRSLLAVKRRMSLDTGENRLLLSMSRMAKSMINAKIDCVGKQIGIGISEEEEFLRTVQLLEDVDGIEEIHRWENMPPNNVLLSDRYYRQIWNAWNELNGIDGLIEYDFIHLSEHLTTILFGFIIDILKARFRFAQQLITTDYRKCAFDVKGGILRGISLNSHEIAISHNGTVLTIQFDGSTVLATVRGTALSLSRQSQGNQEEIEDIELTPGTIIDIAERVISALNISDDVPTLNRDENLIRCRSIAMDLFHLRPIASCDGKAPAPLPFRLLGQNQTDTTGEMMPIPCEASKALIIEENTQFFSTITATQDVYRSQALHLSRMLRGKIDCRSFAFTFPDCYSEFDLSALRSSLRIAFRNIETLPQSVATLFYCNDKFDWKKSFKNGDFALVADINGTCCMLTLLKGEWADPEKYAGYDGLIWERYPSFSIDFSAETETPQGAILEKFCSLNKWNGLPISENRMLNIFGIDGLTDITRDTAFLLDNKTWCSLDSNEIGSLTDLLKLNISDILDDFLKKMRGLVRKQNVHTILLSSSLVCDTKYNSIKCEHKNAVEGYVLYKNVLDICGNKPLWRDHLPSLSIKRFVGQFDLVKDENAPINPVYHRSVPIKIESTFTLPKGQKSYRFQLIQGSSGTGIRYAAVVEHKAFPLKEDAECRLRMSYSYGSDEPYSLIFEPLNASQAGFREAKVKWTQLEHFDIDNMPMPPFPTQLSWAQLKDFPNRRHPERGNSDLVDWVATGLNKLTTQMELPRATYTLIKPLKPSDWQKTSRPFRTAVAYAKAGNNGNNLIQLKMMDTLFDSVDETNQVITVLSCSLQEMRDPPKYESIRLSEYQVTWRENKFGHWCTVKRIKGNEKQNIIFYESKFEEGTFSEDVDLISFRLLPAKAQKDSQETILLGEHYLQWRKDRNGFNCCNEYVELSDGTEEKVFFHEGSFLFDDDFPPPDYGTLSFRLQRRPNGSCSARDIVVGTLENYSAASIVPGNVIGCYNTRNLRVGNLPSFDSVLHCKRTLFFPLHTVFMGGRSLADIECSDDLRNSVRKAVPHLLKAYKNRKLAHDSEDVSFISLSILSRLSENIGKEYYSLAENAVDSFIDGETVVATIGYALGSLQTEMQQNLWAKILTIPKVEDVIQICAHAVWNNSRFLFVVDRTRILGLFEQTTRLLSEQLKDKEKPDLYFIKHTLPRYVEFLLSVFRLRELNDPEINDYLSLNNPIIEKLYHCIEVLYELKIPIRTFLSFQVNEDIPYEDMPDIIYTIIVCITGESGDGEIIISGMNEDLDDDMEDDDQFDDI